MIRKTGNAFAFAFKGLKTVWREENNFRLEVIAGLLVIIVMTYFDFSLTEKLFCIFAVTLVWMAEILNTAVEDICNFVEPNINPVIGKIKDTMSAFVLVSSLGALVVGILVFCEHFGLFVQ